MEKKVTSSIDPSSAKGVSVQLSKAADTFVRRGSETAGDRIWGCGSKLA